MSKKDLPLIFFTLFVQASVGSFITRELVSRLCFVGMSDSLRIPIQIITGATSLGLLVIGMVVAMAHLRKPSRAYLAIGNLRSSWLSREMLLGVLFGFLALGYPVMTWIDATQAAIHALGMAGVAVGVALVWVISRLYMLRTVPAWNSPATPLAFFATTVGTGASITIFGLALFQFATESPNHATIQIRSIAEPVGILVMASLVAQVVALRVIFASGKILPELPPLGPMKRTINLRLLCSITGAIIFFVASAEWLGMVPPGLLWILGIGLGTLLLFVGELLGRIVFFGLYKRVGL